LSFSSTFLAQQVQLVVFVSAFVVVSTVWSVSSLLFFYSRCPRAQPFVKVEGTAPMTTIFLKNVSLNFFNPNMSFRCSVLSFCC